MVLASGVLLAARFLVGATLPWACWTSRTGPQPGRQALQALHAIGEDFFIPFVAGMGLMLLAAGLATVRANTRRCPAG
ncbi:hypothetical protein ABZT06_37180 [Streptomyces sp. NPDC005483]|uniref:hypothetical protein n=1 Tax=Streptomyces sp. NPDC005483 TaxID=3154882 RepID=UPI00339E7F7C